MIPAEAGRENRLHREDRFEILKTQIDGHIARLAKAKSPLTQEVYKATCREFFREKWDEIHTDGTLSIDHLESYIGEQKARGIPQTTITKKLSGLSALFSKLVKLGLMKENLVKLLDSGEKERGDPKMTATLKPYEVKAIFDAMNPQAHNFKYHRALLGIGFYTGLRATEITTLKFGNFIQSEGFPAIKTKIKHRKYAKDHIIPIHPVLKRYLDEYFFECLEKGIDTSNLEGYVFTCNRKGFKGEKPVTHNGLNYIFMTALKRAGIERDGEKRYSTHCMRRTLGNTMEQKDVPLYRIQKVYGHKSADTTVKYLDPDEDLAKSGVWTVRY